MQQEIDKRKEVLDELNTVAAQVYDFVETEQTRITRRRLLVIQVLLSIDANANAVFRLIDSQPRYLDGAQMVLRSMLDVSLTNDWVLKQRDNKRLWRWLRDDRKTLHMQLTNIVSLKKTNPKLDDKNYPLQEWEAMLTKVTEELERFSKKAGVTTTEKEKSLFAKVKDLGGKTQLLYNTVFWLFSSKTHASPTGMQDLIQLDPIRLKRRNSAPTPADNEYALILLDTALTWYVANIRRVAFYLKAPQLSAARQLYEKILKRAY